MSDERDGQLVAGVLDPHTETLAGALAADAVHDAGEFAVRGSIVDLFPAGEPDAIRLDFFGDEIETMRRFDPADQRTTGKAEAFTLMLARRRIGASTPSTTVPRSPTATSSNCERDQPPASSASAIDCVRFCDTSMLASSSPVASARPTMRTCSILQPASEPCAFVSTSREKEFSSYSHWLK